ncbi:MAG TPA: bifunctional oligoribonuclease/PAP phosphatase NrnA [Actinomycetota bacterium]|nr:bifunctional oligoribonuclease/PAP phosphatase NrnA [Actinomycetota bacterium]
MSEGGELRRAADLLGSAPEVALACHVNPDADALGSMLGLSCFLGHRGKRIVATWPNGMAEPPRWLEGLPGREYLVEPKNLPKAPSVLVTLDAADPGRLAGLEHLLKKAATVICIDHHRTNRGFGTIDLVDGEAAATAELVFLLIERMGGDLTPDVAACLYAGLVTDTGRFQYESATPTVLRIAATLREQPFDHAALAQTLYEDNSLPYLRLLGKVLDRAVHAAEADLIWTYLLRNDLKVAGVPIQETDDLIDVLRTAREADVCAVLKEQRDGGFKVSLRSRGKTDVAAVSSKFGGGGHRLASGYTSKADVEETGKTLVRALAEARG